MITYVQGDLLQAPVDAIAHGCNCQKIFGAGVALQIARKWPEVVQADQDLASSAEERLGQIDVVKLEAPTSAICWVINCYTQFNFGAGVQVDYQALLRCVQRLGAYMAANGISVAIPKIGAGLAGGDWRTIEGVINSQLPESQELFVYTLPGDGQ